MPRSDVVPMISALLIGVPLARAAAQNPAGSVLLRSPNMVTGWVSDPGTLQFNFLHRFTESGAPEHQISNSPTFLVAAGLPGRTTAGFAYSTSSQIAPGRPNEWEFFGRVMPFAPGNPVADVTLHAGYNYGAASTDGELGLARSFGALRLLGAGRVFSNAFRAGDRRTALAGGTNIRLVRWLAVAGDVGSMNSRRAGERIAWSAGLQIGIPTTPHSFSIQATNANTGTLEGVSLGTSRTRYGFEYTVPITLGRYFKAFRPRVPDTVAQAADSTPSAAPNAAPMAAVVPNAMPVPDTTARTVPAAPAAPPATEPMRVTKDPAPAMPTPPAASAPVPTTPGVATAPAPARAARPAAVVPAVRRDTVRASMKTLEYAPVRIEVAAGATVVWTNNAPVPHTVVADDRSFDSGNIDVGKRWAHTFTKPGTYAFHCTPHPFMKGVVIVR